MRNTLMPYTYIYPTLVLGYRVVGVGVNTKFCKKAAAMHAIYRNNFAFMNTVVTCSLLIAPELV